MIDIRCFTCGFYDPDFECTCSPMDKWYACSLEPEPDPQIFIGTGEDGEHNKTE